MKFLQSINEYNLPIEIDWSCVLDENMNINVDMSQHSIDRSNFRNNEPVDIKKADVETLVQKAGNTIKQSIDKFSTFVIHGLKTQLNVIGSAFKSIDKIIFKVLTVMVKPDFKPKPWDKYIPIMENLNESVIIPDEKLLLNLKNSLIEHYDVLFDITKTGDIYKNKSVQDAFLNTFKVQIESVVSANNINNLDINVEFRRCSSYEKNNIYGKYYICNAAYGFYNIYKNALDKKRLIQFWVDRKWCANIIDREVYSKMINVLILLLKHEYIHHTQQEKNPKFDDINVYNIHLNKNFDGYKDEDKDKLRYLKSDIELMAHASSFVDEMLYSGMSKDDIIGILKTPKLYRKKINKKLLQDFDEYENFKNRDDKVWHKFYKYIIEYLENYL